MGKNIWRTADIHCQVSNETSGNSSTILHTGPEICLKIRPALPLTPWIHPFSLLERPTPELLFHSFRFSIFPGVQNTWTHVLFWKVTATKHSRGGALQTQEHRNRLYCNNTRGSSLNKSQVWATLHWTREIIPHEEVSRYGPNAVILPFSVYLSPLPVQVTIVFKIFLTPFSLDVFNNMILEEFFQQLYSLFAGHFRAKVLTAPQQLMQPIHSFGRCEATFVTFETTAMFP